MKKIFVILLFAVITCSCFHSCRKGADDPFLSFRSRKSRLAGTWKIVKGSETYSHVNSNSISTLSITDGTYKKVTSGSIDQTGSIKMEYNFGKDWTYSFLRVEEYAGQSDTFTAKGTWTFLSASGNMKNKEAILLTQLSSTLSLSIVKNKDAYTKNNEGITWRLTRLKNNYLVMDSEVEHISPNPYSEVIHYEFEQ